MVCRNLNFLKIEFFFLFLKFQLLKLIFFKFNYFFSNELTNSFKMVCRNLNFLKIEFFFLFLKFQLLKLIFFKFNYFFSNELTESFKMVCRNLNYLKILKNSILLIYFYRLLIEKNFKNKNQIYQSIQLVEIYKMTCKNA